MISAEKAIEILNDCAAMGVRAIQFTGGGEPTVHPQHIELFELTSTLGMSWSLVTNGIKLLPKHTETFLKASWIRVSLDAGSAEAYASIREAREVDFDKVLANVTSLCEARERDSQLIVGVGYVVTPDNFHEVVQAAKLVRETGADNLRVSAMFSPENENMLTPEQWEIAENSCKLAEDEQTESFQVFNRFEARRADLVQHNPDYETCGYQHFTTYIGGDLNVYRCCNTSYNTRGLLGSLEDQRFKHLWYSQEVRDQLNNFNARGCDKCQFNGINRFINYLAADRPDHVEFV
jgi:MoaA/NifB/PqqE/SkfB family radical SAM enzyme